MTTTKKISKKLLSIIICIALLMSYLPAMMASAAPKSAHYNKAVDTNTMSNWTKYFNLTNLDTSNAGGVWTDKTVLSDATAAELGGLITMKDTDRNFLTVLSGLAANKEVVGYSTLPTDTVLILDLSGSMENSNSESALVNATNNAIAELLAVNENNRVGVVLYSAAGSTGSSTYTESVTRILPIDRYTTGADNVYLNLSNNGTVSVDNNVVGTKSGADLDNTKSFGGGTYIQAGLWEAMKMFEEMDTVIGQGNWQTDEARMPITVLMSDGAASTGTSYYDDVENSRYTTGWWNGQTVYASNAGNGEESGLTAGNAFLTQLTAAYVSSRIDAHYKTAQTGVRSLFYTLGFNIGNNSIATAVMNPDASTLTDSLWTSYNELSSTGNLQVEVKGRNSRQTQYTDVSIARNSYATSKSYVDQYFSASGTGLQDAFDNIVDEIILQSRYYPTHIEGGSSDFSGYVDFVDTIGEYMEIKDVKGILLGNTLYDGHMMASKLADSTSTGLGTVDNPTNLGDEFIRAIKTRLGISSTDDAQALVAKAYGAGQLKYNSATDWSNYIGWYAKADGTYNGFWDEKSLDPAPANSVYKVKSYGFLGVTSGSIKNSDMMYMSVQIRTDIATGTQTMFWKIPASLIPMVTYLVSLEGDNVNSARNVQVAVENNNPEPVRLVYETGLRSDINEFNVTRIIESKHIAADGETRVFWNNYFDISSSDHEHHVTATAEFTPSLENERYYYTFDSAVLKKIGENSYELVPQNETPDTAGEYYRRRYIFTDDSTTPVFFYERMSASSIAAAAYRSDYETLDNQLGAWVVPAGTPARELQMYSELKTDETLTDSAHMIFYPYLTEANNMVYVDMNLGNNGMLSVVPETGMKISKTIDIYETGTEDTFRFRIEATGLNGSFNAYITELDVVPTGTPNANATFTNGVCEVELKQNQTIWISGIPAGTEYTVTELITNPDYKVKSVHVNGASTGTAAVGTVAQYHIDDIDFENTAIGEGNLYVTKQVVDQNGNNVDIASGVKFTVEITLTDVNGAPVSGTFENVTVPATGRISVTLEEGQTVSLRGLPEGTRYTVVETAVPNGFAFNNTRSAGRMGIISQNAANQAIIVNDYVPTSTNGTPINVEVVKQITGNRTEWQSGESYSFTFQEVDPATEQGTTLKNITINGQSAIKNAGLNSRVAPIFNLSSEIYTEAGEYFYKIVETVGTQGGVTYDTAERRFSVVVADSGMDGSLEIVEVKNWLNTTISGNYTVATNFNNVYAPKGSATTTINIQKAINDNRSLAGFQFALYDADPSSAADVNELARSNVTAADGKAKIDLTYAANRATMAGETYTYYLAEIKGDYPNITYSTQVYTVKVTVKDNGDGTVSATNVIENVATGPATVENVYTQSDADYVTISGEKVISTGNRVVNAGEFKFDIEAVTPNAPMPEDDVTSVTNDEYGYFIFPAIEFKEEHAAIGTPETYIYRITEDDTNRIGGFELNGESTYDQSEYYVTVTVKNEQAIITADAVITKDAPTGTGVEVIRFDNKYYPVEANFGVGATKLLDGKELADGEFEFEVTAVSENAPMPTTPIARNDALGDIDFGIFTYDKVGTYVYTISEKNGGNPLYEYDSSVYVLTVTVTDDSVGTLSADTVLTKNNMPATDLVFHNGYNPEPMPYDIDARLGVEKSLDGRTIVEGEFEFAVINAISGIRIGESVKNGADGTVDFPAIEIPEAGHYSFKILEVAGTEKGVSYDTNQYLINIDVVQNADGSLSISNEELHIGREKVIDVGGVPTEITEFEDITSAPMPRVKFANTYKADATEIVIGGAKKLTGRALADKEFTFNLYAADAELAKGALLEQVKNGADGSFAFTAIAIADAGVYNYYVAEDSTEAMANITYDKSEYLVTVTVTDNLDGTLKVAYEYAKGDEKADEIVFTNIYTEPTPQPEPEPKPQPEPEPEPQPEPEPEPQPEPEPEPEIPTTGDEGNFLWMLLALAFVSALSVIATGKFLLHKENS